MGNSSWRGAVPIGLLATWPSRFALRLFFFFFLSVLPTFSQTVAPANTADNLENEGASARVFSMGSAFVGLADDPSALFFNPAGLSSMQGSEFDLHHNSYLAGTFQETLVYGFNAGDMGGMAGSLNYINWGTLDLRDSSGLPQGNYNDSDVAFRFGWGRELGNGFSAGLALRGVQEKIINSLYNSLNWMGGLLYSPVPSLRLGVSYLGLGASDAGQNLAENWQGGGSYRLTYEKNDSVLLSLSGQWQPGGVSRLQGGVEGNWDGLLFLRAGYQFPLDGQIAGNSSAYSFGAGLKWMEFSLDYAYVPYGDFGVSHRVSLGYSIPQAPKQVVQVPVTVIQKVVVQPAVTPEPVSDKSQVQVKFKISGGEGDQAAVSVIASPQQEAINQGLLLVKAEPQDPQSWWKLGNAYYQAHQKDSAVQCFEQTLRLKPDNLSLKAWLEKYKASPTQ